MTPLSIKENVERLNRFRGKIVYAFPSYITHIRFPKFKNLAPNSRVDFTFPVTALVGANGSGKTSVLHALYGAPNRYSTGDFWFSTEVDPILEGEGSPNRFIYGHFHIKAKKVVETRKARVQKFIGKVENPNYWEPTKIVDSDDMEPLPTLKSGVEWEGMSTDRWNPVKRKVIYINFRKELSAFDKYFYFGNDPALKILKKKQDLIRRDAKILQKIIDAGDKSILFNSKKTTIENRNLSPAELTWISFILGREYKSAKFIRHRLFKGNDGLSVQFTTNFGKYSEAFAGSGEVAVTSVVVQVLKAPKGALILLDEPEVSLHPGAQERLLTFLLEMAEKSRLQVIFSTHAPQMLAGLPEDALKIFLQETNGAFSILSESHPYAAFQRLGVRHVGEIRIIVEDRLAKRIVELAILSLDDISQRRFIVEFHPGGATAILTHRIPIMMHDGADVFFLLDGDQKKKDHFDDPGTIPASADHNLAQNILEAVGAAPVFVTDGNSNGGISSQLVQLQRQYLNYITTNLMYLPARCPEEIIINSIPEHIPAGGIQSSDEAKKILRRLAENVLGKHISSVETDDFGIVKIAEKRESSPEILALTNLLKSIIANFPLPK